ncbi:MAG TPA: glycerophosphodiester phosphodiesterase [Hyphomicrobiales bacterium]|nr:glycerophosphodiester phosphodiesterase [Hyphomicrobiales bacterium]
MQTITLQCRLALFGLLLGFSAMAQEPLDSPPPPTKLIVAHRGASGYLPEHTLEAKALAVGLGADYLEQDLVLTRDDRLVVFHDLTLERMTDVASVFPQRQRADGHYYVIDFALEELLRLRVHEGTQVTDAGEQAIYPARFPPTLGTFRLHTLEQELELIQGLEHSTGRRIGIYPELKSPWFHRQEGKDLSRAVLEVLQRYGYGSRDDALFLQSFDHPELVRVHESLLPEFGMQLKLVQLIADNAWQETWELGEDGVWRPYDYTWMHEAAGFERLARVVDGVGPAWNMLLDQDDAGALQPRLRWVREAHAAGLVVHPYTFRREAEQLPPTVGDFDGMLQLFLETLDVDGVFTDFPDLVADFLRRRH